MFDLSGDVALITGGNGVLGLGFARGLVKSGASVAIWGRDEAKNGAAVEELSRMGGDAAAFACDVTDESQIADAFAQTLDRFGKVDSCFANVGGAGFRGMSHAVGRSAWLEAIDLNLMSVVQTFGPATAHMMERKTGRLIVTSSIAGLVGTPGAASYSTTKAALLGLVRALAIELGAAGIRVNAILPGYIESEMSSGVSAEFVEGCQRRSAIGRIGTAEDMEGIAVFLASKHSDYLTGQSIVMDGGHTIFPL